MFAVGGVLGLGRLAGVRHERAFRSGTGGEQYRREAPGAAPRAWQPRGQGRTAPRARGAGLPGRVGALGVALGVRLRARARSRRRARHGLEVAELGQPREPERVQAVAGQQREVGVVGAHARGPRRSAAGSPRGSPRRAARSPRRRARRRSPCGRAPSPGRRPRRRAGRPRRAASAASRSSALTRSPRTRPRRPRACG